MDTCPRMRALAGTPMLLILCGVSLAQDKMVADEYDLKAAFIYNLAKFIEWPKEGRPREGSPFKIGILGKDPSKGRIQSSLSGKTVSDFTVTVESFEDAKLAAGFQIVFVPAGETDTAEGMLKGMLNRPVLTLGEREDFIHSGGLMTFYQEENKIRLALNQEQAVKAGFTISSKLLRVVKVVKEK